MPPNIVLLDYNRFRTRSLAERLVRQRTSLGMSQKEAPREIGVDQGTLARWEREPTGEMLDGFLAGDRGQRMRVRRAGEARRPPVNSRGTPAEDAVLLGS